MEEHRTSERRNIETSIKTVFLSIHMHEKDKTRSLVSDVAYKRLKLGGGQAYDRSSD
jgi:hypothetical protein